MKKSWGLIPKILSGEKTIESRWYQSRRAPWGRVETGDTVYFKNSGEAIEAQALISRVWQFTFSNQSEVERVTKKYGKKICLVDPDVQSWHSIPRYCILMELSNPRSIKPFQIDKKGFGSAAAWLTVPDIRVIKTRT